MAFKLFVDPNVGAQAYARGIEKFGEGIGKAIQGYRNHKDRKEKALGLLAAYDVDNFKQEKEYLVQQNDKDKQETLLGHYERKLSLIHI